MGVRVLLLLFGGTPLGGRAAKRLPIHALSSTTPQQTPPLFFLKKGKAASPASPEGPKESLSCCNGDDAGRLRLRHPASLASPMTHACVTDDAPQPACVTT